jgi:polar amino acid transport system substrate-binding protein
MDVILAGLERGEFDAAIGAITTTPGRLARVDFSYPTHRSGVAVAFSKEAGPIAAVLSYGAGVKELSFLIVVILALLLLIGVLMWSFERPRRNATQRSDSSVTTLNEGIYRAVVAMTIVGYGDKTPKTPIGRFIAVLWMLGSLALIFLLSTSLVARMTADWVEAGQIPRNGDLEGKRLAAVANSSGAEYLDEEHFQYTKYTNLQEALASMASGRSDAVVNSVGALQYLISTQFSGVIPTPRGLLAPAYMAFALPQHSPLKKSLDSALIEITASESGDHWRTVTSGGRTLIREPPSYIQHDLLGFIH